MADITAPRQYSLRPLFLVAGASVLVVAIVTLVGHLFYVVIPAGDYLPFHLLTETASIAVSFSIFALYWNAHRETRDARALFISTGFLAVAILDTMHMLSFPGMPEFVTPSSTNKGILYWVPARVWAAIVLLAGLFVNSQSQSRFLGPGLLLILNLALAALIFVVVSFFSTYIPAMFAPGWGLTPLKIGVEYLVVVLSIAAAVLYSRAYGASGNRFLLMLAMALVVTVSSELFFTLYASAYDIYNFMGHVAKAVAYYLIFLAMFVSGVRQPYEEAQAERNRLRVLIDTTPVGIIVYSTADRPRPVLFNAAAEAILGQPLVPGIGIAEMPAHYGIRRPTGEPLPFEELVSFRALHGESTAGVDLLVRQPSGREVHILANSAPIRDADGRIIGAVVAFQDITVIKEQERLLDEFISTAAHELKTPVATIKGYAQLMRQWAPGGHEPREGKAIDVINAQVDRIGRRVQEMLQVVRFRTVPVEPRRMRFDLGGLAALVVERMQSTTEIHRLVIQQKEATLVEADPERIEEVLVNLLDNAISYSPKGGDIQVRVWAGERDAMVSVKDQGVGIPKDRQPHIFGPFYEAVPSGAVGYRGVVALSLYLSKLTVERHKGRIWFESEEGRGSTFYISLPLAKEGNGRQE